MRNKFVAQFQPYDMRITPVSPTVDNLPRPKEEKSCNRYHGHRKSRAMYLSATYPAWHRQWLSPPYCCFNYLLDVGREGTSMFARWEANTAPMRDRYYWKHDDMITPTSNVLIPTICIFRQTVSHQIDGGAFEECCLQGLNYVWNQRNLTLYAPMPCKNMPVVIASHTTLTVPVNRERRDSTHAKRM